jgi:hypothetical protein
MVAAGRVVEAGVQHRLPVGRLDMHAGQRGPRPGELVFGGSLVGAADRGQRGADLGGDMPAPLRMVLPVHQGRTALAQVEGRVIEAHHHAVLQRVVHGIEAGRGGVGPALAVVRDGTQPPGELARGLKLIGSLVVQRGPCRGRERGIAFPRGRDGAGALAPDVPRRPVVPVRGGRGRDGRGGLHPRDGRAASQVT